MGQFDRWRPSEPTTSFQRQLPQQGQIGISGKCNKCGRNSHQHPNYCPAINSNCNVCNKRGHFVRVCRAAARSAALQFTDRMKVRTASSRQGQ